MPARRREIRGYFESRSARMDGDHRTFRLKPARQWRPKVGNGSHQDAFCVQHLARFRKG
jgi:hypothetical protein